MNETSDTQLVQEYLDGNAEAFDVLVTRHAKPVFAFTQRLLGNNRVSNETQDIVQNTFLKAWKQLKKFDPAKASFKSWLFTIAHHTTIDWLRKRRPLSFSDMSMNEQVDDETETSAFENQLADPEPLAHELFEQGEIKEIVENLLDDLHPEERSIIILHHYEELTFEEIADVLKKPMNTVKSRHRRAMKKLHQKAAPPRNKQ